MEKQTALESNAEYEAFVDKFKPKLTTDDCYTPPEVYEVVKNGRVQNMGLILQKSFALFIRAEIIRVLIIPAAR